ncbi:hypothetical protein [Mucilaginibacter boryungensis]|uniref:DUF2007 domain-containing protein n=1 Tax=Mucilaginibacter boryungensis TaxID=768480 RepID=A0ABR9XMD9_9SPHI|nr:hypothetical protein [Mucilaginibacter boryungensis]MBE9668224.1 hypothetical protein [Mucilaginibacter boryungensis]
MENETRVDFLRGSSFDETERAKEMLKASNIDFTEVFSNSSYSPVVISSTSALPYEGEMSIRGYCDLFNQSI